MTLAESAELEVSPGTGDNYRGCVCTDEAKTFQWGVRATSLGTELPPPHPAAQGPPQGME